MLDIIPINITERLGGIEWHLWEDKEDKETMQWCQCSSSGVLINPDKRALKVLYLKEKVPFAPFTPRDVKKPV